MRITHVCPTVDREASGLSKAVLDMAESLDRSGVDVDLYTTGGAPRRSVGGVSLHRFRRWRVPERLLVAPRLRKALEESLPQTELIHSHGLWTFPSAYALRAALRGRIPAVATAHGAFNPWSMSRSRIRKKVMWALLHGPLFRQAACLHATSDAEASVYRRMGLTAPIAVIPLGIDVPETLSARNPGSVRKLLFLSRLHPEKGIELLLKAWCQIQQLAAGWELHIVGPGHAAYSSKLQRLASDLHCDRVVFRGPLFGSEKSCELRSADAFVLTTHNENFGLAVAEALAHGLPALVTQGAPWGGLTLRKCGWWVKADVAAISDALADLTSRSGPELEQMGAAGRQWMRDDFSMTVMGYNLRKLYEWLLGGGAAPEFVQSRN